MSNKKINPDNLSRVNGAFKDMSGELEHNVSDLISSSATEKIEAATDGIKKLSKEMVETISSLDEYLGAVGEAFRSADASMAQSIGQNMYTKAPESRAERRECYIQGGTTTQEQHTRRKQVEIGESLYKDFP